MYLKRIADNTFKKAKKSFASILIYGPRQVGKSTLALFNLDENITKVTLDDSNIFNLASTSPDTFLNLYKWPLFIDECQKAPNLFSAIKIKIDEEKYKWMKEDESQKLMYVLSFSNQFELRNKAYESLVGRVFTMKINSFSYPEKNRLKNLNRLLII